MDDRRAERSTKALNSHAAGFPILQRTVSATPLQHASPAGSLRCKPLHPLLTHTVLRQGFVSLGKKHRQTLMQHNLGGTIIFALARSATSTAANLLPRIYTRPQCATLTQRSTRPTHCFSASTATQLPCYDFSSENTSATPTSTSSELRCFKTTRVSWSDCASK